MDGYTADMRPHKSLDLPRLFQNKSRQLNRIDSLPIKCLMTFTLAMRNGFKDKTRVRICSS
jgi:hypothetical protein